MFRAVILVRRVPDGPPVAQRLDHAAHVVARDCLTLPRMALAAAALNIVVDGIVVRPVGAIDRKAEAEQFCAYIDVGEVQSHQNHTDPLTLRRLQVLQPLDCIKALQPPPRPKPGHTRFEKSYAYRGHDRPSDLRSPRDRPTGKAEVEIAARDFPATRGAMVQQPPQQAPEGALHPIGQQRQAVPEQKSQPGQPIPGME